MSDDKVTQLHEQVDLGLLFYATLVELKRLALRNNHDCTGVGLAEPGKKDVFIIKWEEIIDER